MSVGCVVGVTAAVDVPLYGIQVCSELLLGMVFKY
jgi:hypothetical protein